MHAIVSAIETRQNPFSEKGYKNMVVIYKITSLLVARAINYEDRRFLQTLDELNA